MYRAAQSFGIKISIKNLIRAKTPPKPLMSMQINGKRNVSLRQPPEFWLVESELAGFLNFTLSTHTPQQKPSATDVNVYLLCPISNASRQVLCGNYLRPDGKVALHTHAPPPYYWCLSHGASS